MNGLVRATAQHSADSLVVIATWLTWLQAQSADTTVTHYRQTVFRFFQRHPLHPSEVTEDHILEFIQSFPPRSAAQRGYFQGLRSFFGYCYRRKLIEHDPTEGIKIRPPEEKVPRALTDAELLLVVAAANSRASYRGATLKLLYYTAARVGEVVTLKWEDVSAERVTIHGHKSNKERIVDMTVPLHHTLGELWSWSATYDRVVPRASATVWQWCRQAGQESGIARVHPHLFRSTAATKMTREGANPYAAQRVLGHAKIDTTMRYTAVSDEDRHIALEKLAVAGL